MLRKPVVNVCSIYVLTAELQAALANAYPFIDPIFFGVRNFGCEDHRQNDVYVERDVKHIVLHSAQLRPHKQYSSCRLEKSKVKSHY